MKQMNSFLTIITLTIMMFVACDNEDNNIKPQEDNSETVIINASSYTDWVYFSFEQGKMVAVNDVKNSVNWDIAFHRSNVKLNCGLSGIGKGGAYDAGRVDFNSIKEAPTSGYTVDELIEIKIDISSYPPATSEEPGNKILAKWLSYAGPPTTYIYNNNIFVIKTAQGKYAKVFLKGYFNDENQSGYVTMKYFYQPNGSNKLQ